MTAERQAVPGEGKRPTGSRVTKPDRFYGDPVEKFNAMADADHSAPIDVAHFKMWCRVAAREIEYARSCPAHLDPIETAA